MAPKATIVSKLVRAFNFRILKSMRPARVDSVIAGFIFGRVKASACHAILAAVAIAFISWGPFTALHDSTMLATGFMRSLVFFFRSGRIERGDLLSRPMVRIDFWRAMAAVTALGIGPFRSIILQPRHSPPDGSVYRLSVNKMTLRGVISAQLSSPEKAVVYVTFSTAVSIRQSSFFDLMMARIAFIRVFIVFSSMCIYIDWLGAEIKYFFGKGAK